MRRHITLWAVPLLATALALTGCENPLKPERTEPGPEGAYVTVRLETPGSAAARTVYPVLPSLSKYELSFSGPEARDPVTVSPGGPHLIALAPGTWTISATAFTGTEGAWSAIARGSAGVTASLGETTVANIILAPVSGEAGTFRYAITLPAGAAGSLVITTAEGGAVSGGTISLQPGALASGVLPLPTGQYLMNISLILGDRWAGRTEALHIYPYRESAVEYRFFEHDFRLVSDLAHNRWEEKTLNPGEVHWYKFTAEGEAAYRVQWNGAPPQGDGTKSLPVSVSAYTGDNTFIFENKTSGWVSPEAVSGIDGTVYLRVQGANGTDSGSYALRYYSPAGLPPQEGINLSAKALPVPVIFLSWNTVPGAAGYRLYRTTDPAVGYNQIGDFNTALYEDRAVYGGMTYYYRVSAYSALGEGEKSPAVSAAPPLAAVLSEKVWAGGTLRAGETKWYTFTAEAAMTCLIQWNGASPQGDGTKTLPALVSAYTSDNGIIFEDKTEGWTSPETLSGLEGILCIKVEGLNGGAGTFALRYYDPVTTPPVSLAAPVISGAGDGTLRTSWEAVPWATAYEVWTGTSNNTAAAAQYGDDVSELAVTLSGLANGTVYYVWVKAKNDGGTGGFSPAASGKPIGSMGTVTLAVSDGQLRASWAAVAGADQYEVYYSTAEAMPENPAQTVDAARAAITERFDGTPYTVWVRPKNVWGMGSASAPVRVIPATGVSLNKSAVVIIAGNTETLTAEVSPSNASNPTVTWTSNNPAVATVSAGTVRAIGAGTAVISAASADGGITAACTVTVQFAAQLYVGSNTNPEPGVISLEGAFTWLDSNAASNTAYTIIVYQNSTISARTLEYSGKTNVGLTLKGNSAGRSVQLSGTGYHSLFTVNSGVTLAVENLTLRGMGSTAAAPLVSVSGGSLEMRQDSLITENYNTPSVGGGNGGGVCVYSGTFTMKGNSSVSGNRAYKGGGVYISSGTFTMQDSASVSGNTAYDGGGGVYVGSSGTFTMQDAASISGNTASSSFGGGVYVSSGTLTMQDNASVSGNTVSYYGGGVCVYYGTFTMQDNASVSGNTASSTSNSSYGGGVYVYSSGIFTMKGSASVSNNTVSDTRSLPASIGGGVYVSGTFTMQNNALISDNTASAACGGVYVNSGSFTMQDSASISGNMASIFGGGGVQVSTNGTFTKKGGTIYGDTDTTHTTGSTENTAANGYGHAVYLYDGDKKRNSTADTAVNLYAKYTDGAWTYNDTSADGVGDTTANWE